jgi:hypothetical protein
MAVFNHTLPQSSCFTESCKFNEGEQRCQILAGYPHPKKRRENAKQSGYLTRCLPSSQMKNTFDCTNAWKKVFSIANFLLDLGSSPFFLHCNSHWSASQAPANRHKLVTPGTKRRRHREKEGAGGKISSWSKGQKRLVPRSENLRFYRIQQSSNWDTTTTTKKKKLPMQKLPDTSWHSYNDRFKSDGSIGRPGQTHHTEKTPFPWNSFLRFLPSPCAVATTTMIA